MVHAMLQKTASSCGLLISFLLVIPDLASPTQEISRVSPVLPQRLNASSSSTLPSLNASSPDNPARFIQCSGQLFGFNPDLADCGSAKEYISPDVKQYPWGARHTGLGPEVFPLPWRMMGG